LGAVLVRPDRRDEPARFGTLRPVRQWIESVIDTLKGQLAWNSTGAAPWPGSTPGSGSACSPWPQPSASTGSYCAKLKRLNGEGLVPLYMLSNEVSRRAIPSAPGGCGAGALGAGSHHKVER
jgi:hypothetical protein